MNIAAIPYIFVNLTALTCFNIMLIIFLATKKTREIWFFIILLMDCITWSGGSVLMRFQMYPGINFWYTVSLVSLFCMEFLFYHFVYIFYKCKEKLTLFLCMIGTIAIMPGTISGYFLSAPSPVTLDNGSLVFQYTTTWRIAIPCVLFIVIIACTISLLKKIARREGIKSPGLNVLINSGAIMLIGNLMQVLIPGNTFPFDALAGIIFGALLMTALYKRRLFRMRMIVSSGILVLSLLVVSLIFALSFIVPLCHVIEYQMGLTTDQSMIIVFILFALILVFFGTIMKQALEKIFNNGNTAEKRLNAYSKEVSQTLNSKEIMQKLSAVILSEIPIKRVFICLRDKDRLTVRYCSDTLAEYSFSLSAKSALATCLRDSESCMNISVFRNMPIYLSIWETDKNILKDLKIGCAAAMKDSHDLYGIILLSEKKKGKDFTVSELNFVETVSSITSIALKNAGLYEKMFREARIDPLTGLYNYRYFSEKLKKSYNECKNEALSLMLIDIDDFKLYNQLYGTSSGDYALKNISGEIQKCAGKNPVFRTSGKVFAVLMPGHDTKAAVTLAEEIRRKINEYNQKDTLHIYKNLTVSIGICSSPYAASNAKELLDNADLATFNAKRNGKDQITVFHYSMDFPENFTSRTRKLIENSTIGEDGYRDSAPTVAALTAAIDAKDHYTCAHSRNVANYAAYLGAAAGLNDDQIRTIYEAGLLHDIGKISIPENILNKNGRLTADEYKTMQGHVNNSIDIIRHLPEMDFVIPAVLGHHERWDAKGYPRGIAGDEIPVTARCLSVADVFDAMTTDRPYRKGMSIDYAVEQLQEGAGTQLDPKLALMFITLIRSHELPLPEELACSSR